VRYACEDLETLRKRLKRLDGEVVGTLQHHKVGQLLTSIGGIGNTTAAMIIAELGDPARFKSAAALAAYVVAGALRCVYSGDFIQSGRKLKVRNSIRGSLFGYF
jgi:transposase